MSVSQEIKGLLTYLLTCIFVLGAAYFFLLTYVLCRICAATGARTDGGEVRQESRRIDRAAGGRGARDDGRTRYARSQ